jgi:uncharacterized protein YndB with AHSA1/START domain
MATVIRPHRVIIQAPLQTVFDYVSDLTRHPEWSSGQLRIDELTSSPIAVGKEYLSHGEVAVQKNRPNRVQIMEYKSPRKFGFVANDPDFGRVSHIFTFTEQKGGVLVERVMALTLSPIIAFFFRFLIYPLIGSPAMERSLALLKAKLEEKP